jgi:hypothetical protein
MIPLYYQLKLKINIFLEHNHNNNCDMTIYL